MSSKVLGRITNPGRPRGPDVEMSISVPDAWLAEGASIEVELPRNLSCAACKGGGCDACDRSGGISLRGKKDPVELMEVTLPGSPSVADPASASTRGLVMRIPERGGLSPVDARLPRGNLLLSVSKDEQPSQGVARVEPPGPPARPSVPEMLRLSLSPASPEGRSRLVVLAVGVAAVVAVLVWWLHHR